MIPRDHIASEFLRLAREMYAAGIARGLRRTAAPIKPGKK